MASRFVPVTDEQIFVLNETAVSPKTKKATKFCLTLYRGIPLKPFIKNNLTKWV
jgi:hypothetical protein